MNMPFFQPKQTLIPVVICNYECLCLNQYFKNQLKNYEKFKKTVELIDENRDNISRIQMKFVNHYPNGSKIIKFIKWESTSYKQLVDNDLNFIEFLNQKFDITEKTYSPHGLSTYWEVELKKPLTLNSGIIRKNEHHRCNWAVTKTSIY